MKEIGMRTLYFGCALMLVALTAQPAAAVDQDTRMSSLPSAQRNLYTFAVDVFRRQRYAAAYGRFARLADAGHIPSAQLALMMYRNGPLLFGNNWDATPEQLERWSALVIKGERDSTDASGEQKM
jgi:hypothetical protein